MRDPHQLAPPIAFFHLAIDQACHQLPPKDFPTSTSHISPLPKMSREGIKVVIQAITREEWETARGQDVSQGVDDGMRSVLRAGTEMEHGQSFVVSVVELAVKIPERTAVGNRATGRYSRFFPVSGFCS